MFSYFSRLGNNTKHMKPEGLYRKHYFKSSVSQCKGLHKRQIFMLHDINLRKKWKGERYSL